MITRKKLYNYDEYFLSKQIEIVMSLSLMIKIACYSTSHYILPIITPSIDYRQAKHSIKEQLSRSSANTFSELNSHPSIQFLTKQYSSCRYDVSKLLRQTAKIAVSNRQRNPQQWIGSLRDFKGRECIAMTWNAKIWLFQSVFGISALSSGDVCDDVSEVVYYGDGCA